MKTNWYWLTVGVLVLAPIPFEFGLWEWDETSLGPWNAGLAVLTVHVAYLILSIRVVPMEERDVVTLLGKPLYEATAGPVIVPWLIGDLIRLPGTAQEIELPGSPEKIWDFKDSEGNELPIPRDEADKWLLPIRVTFENHDPAPEDDPIPGIRATPGDSAADPLKKRVTAKVTPVFRYEIVGPARFIQTFGSKAEAERHFNDLVTAETISLLQVGTLARALYNTEAIGEEITKKMMALLARRFRSAGQDSNPEESWGIHVYPVRLKPFGLSHDLNREIQRIPQAIARAEAKKIEAEGEKRRLTLEGEGVAAARQALLFAEAAGSKELAEKLGVPEPTAILFIDALKQGLASGNHFFFEGGDSLNSLFAKWKTVSDTAGRTLTP